jgi:hypothetical protein
MKPHEAADLLPKVPMQPVLPVACPACGTQARAHRPGLREGAGMACQLPCLQRISEGNAEVPPQSLSRQLKLMIRRRLDPRTERRFKMLTNDLWDILFRGIGSLSRITGGRGRPATQAAPISPVHLMAVEDPLHGAPTQPVLPVAHRPGSPERAERRLQGGDWVRVRPRTEIDATLNHWRQLKGCTFMPEMGEYCGTTQRVLKRVERFVDERDLRVKTARGILLLEGVICQGTADFGRCDRSCFPFWREEWLEKIAERPLQGDEPSA